MLILGIPAQAMTAVLLCSHHAFRLTARPGSSHSRCGRRAQPLSDPQLILPGMTLESGQGNVKFWLVQFPLQGVEVIFFPFRELIRNNSLPKHRLISTLKSELGILHVFKKKMQRAPTGWAPGGSCVLGSSQFSMSFPRNAFLILTHSFWYTHSHSAEPLPASTSPGYFTNAYPEPPILALSHGSNCYSIFAPVLKRYEREMSVFHVSGR